MTTTRYDADYVRRTCAISYRASQEPQTVTIQAQWAKPRGTMARILRSRADFMSEGFAANATFSPTDGKAAWLDAPHLHGVTGPLVELNAVLRVQAVAPWSLRSLIGAMVADATRLSFAGQLSADGTADSLDTDRFLARDVFPDDSPSRWGAVPFALDVDEAPRGASLRIKFAGDVPADYAAGPVGIGVRMPQLASTLMCAFWDRQHDQVASISLSPKVAIAGRELTALWERFGVQPEPFVNILVNHLIWVHHREIPIESVLIRTS